MCFPSLYCSGSRLLCWELSEVGPGLHGLSRSKLLRFRFSGTPQRHRLGWAFVLCPSQVRAAQVTRCLASAVAPSWGLWLIACPIPAAQFSGCTVAVPSQVCRVSLLGADLWLRPSRWMSCIQDPRKAWLSPGSLLAVWWRMPSLGLSLPLSRSGCRLPPCLLQGMGRSAAS